MFCLKNRSVVFLLIFILLIIPAVHAFSQEIIAYFGEVGGEVTVTRSNPGATLEATLGMFLQGGDVIRTGKESYASIIFQDDGSRVKLGDKSQLTLNATRRKDKLDKKTFLETGKLWAKITKRRGTSFEVKTPTSVASVKGTKFILEEKEWGETWLWVLEDFVLLSNDYTEQTINEGQKGKATKDKIEVEEIQKEDIPLEPGLHEMIFYLRKSDGSSLQKELHIELERK